MDEVASALRALTDALDRLSIRYLIGGSIASSARGTPRATMDVDLLARMPPDAASRLPEQLGPDWYADGEEIRRALSLERPFNVIHRPSGEKFDLFPALIEFHDSELQRASPAAVRLGDEVLHLPVASVEDMILAKLQWYRKGGEVSERQWTDVLNLIRMNQDLELSYVHTWAERLGVQDLLNRALLDATADQ